MAAAAYIDGSSSGDPRTIRVVGAEREPIDWVRLLHKVIAPVCCVPPQLQA